VPRAVPVKTTPLRDDFRTQQKRPPLIVRFGRALGPGLTTGASDDDPSGIATYSQAGAEFGYSMLWTMLFSYPLMTAIQEISARIGRVTGKGLAGNLRAYCPRWMAYSIALAVFIANTINIGADLAAMGGALRLLMGGPLLLYTVGIAVLSVLLQIYLSYGAYARMLRWLTLSLFAYAVAAFLAHVQWRTALYQLVVPTIRLDRHYLTTIVAILGTTISPYLFFWQASQEAEEVRSNSEAHPLLERPDQATEEVERIEIDTFVGMGVSNLIGFFIILTCAATLHSSGIRDIGSAQQAAEALRPVAGKLAFVLFSLGIVGTGFLAIPVLAGSAAYAIAGVADWRASLGHPLDRAPRFYAALSAASLLGLAVNFVPIDPMKALYWSAVVNGVVAAPLMAAMIVLASDQRVMGQFRLPMRLRIAGWMCTAVMGISVVGFLVSLRG
jgi:NRAMP (natural resistance-associated macrophage protein)-like metal ion transporter